MDSGNSLIEASYPRREGHMRMNLSVVNRSSIAEAKCILDALTQSRRATKKELSQLCTALTKM